MRISDWSSDVCSSDLASIHCGAPLIGMVVGREGRNPEINLGIGPHEVEHSGCAFQKGVEHIITQIGADDLLDIDTRVVGRIRDAQIGRASCRESVCKYV